MVAKGSSVEGIAQQYNVSQDTLRQLNNLSGPASLIAGDVIDVPLKGSVFSNLLSCEALLLQFQSFFFYFFGYLISINYITYSA